MIKTKRILCLLLAMLMLLPLLVACNKNSDDPAAAETTDAAAGAQASASSDVADESTEEELRYDENGYLMDNLDLKGVNLEGKQINILTNEKNAYYTAPDDLGGAMKASVFNRHMTVITRLNCKLNYVTVDGGYGKDSVVIQTVQGMITEKTVDAVAIYSLTASALMLQGITMDLKKSEMLEFDKPWWNQQLVDSCSIYDRLYFCSGDINHQMIMGAFVYCYNKDFAASSRVNEFISETYEEDDIYALVDSGRWTFDKMTTIAKMVSMNEDGVKTADDLYGYVGNAPSIDNFYQASGMISTTKGADGSFAISSDINSSRAGKVVSDVIEFFKHPGVMNEFSTSGKAADGSTCGTIYNSGNALFHHNQLTMLTIAKNFDEGVLPAPKYDEEQPEYRCVPSFVYTMWCVVRGSANEYEDVCAVMECLASEGHRQTYPTYFDVIIAGREDSADDYDMLHIIHESLVIDGGRVISAPFNDNLFGLFRNAIAGERDYLSYYAGAARTITEQAIALNSLVRNYESMYGSN